MDKPNKPYSFQFTKMTEQEKKDLSSLIHGQARAEVGKGWDVLGEKLQKALLCEELVSHLMATKAEPGSMLEDFQMIVLATLGEHSKKYNRTRTQKG